MNKIKIKFELLDLFDDKEIGIICKNVDLTAFLIIMKDKRYSKYAKTLGRLDKKSAVVQKLLPGMVFHLFQKGDERFKVAIASQLELYQDKFIEAITESMDPPVTIEEIRAYSSTDIAEFYYKMVEISASGISIEMFFIFLKLQGIVYDNKVRLEIEANINQIGERYRLEDQHRKEIQLALKEQEKKLSAEYEHKEYKLKTKIEEIRSLYRECQDKLNITEGRILLFEKETQSQKAERETQWLAEYENILEERKKSDDLQREKNLREAKESFDSFITNLKNEAELKRKKLETEYQEQLIESKMRLATELKELSESVRDMSEQRDILLTSIEELKKKECEISSHIEALNETEDDYFNSFEDRIIERKIDTLILSKLGIAGDTKKHNEKAETLIMDNHLFVVSAIPLSNNVEYGGTVSSIDDFLEDFKSNISLNFENETDISSTVLAGVVCGLGIIASNKVCKHISSALSALTDLRTPLIINIESSKESLGSIVNLINTSDSQVICINGLLDNYDDNLFARICESVNEKYLFFSILDLDNLKMMSKSVFNYAIVLDAEDELHFTEDEYVLIGDHEISPYIPKINISKKREIFKSGFNRLVDKSYIKKSIALKYSEVLQMYYEFVGVSSIGDIMQKTIVNACKFNDFDEEMPEALEKCGITIQKK